MDIIYTRTFTKRYRRFEKEPGFERQTVFIPPDGCEALEITPYKAIFMVKRENSGQALSKIAQTYDLADVSVEDEDIGHVVKRINGKEG